MQVLDNIHAFLWQSMTANNCNTYLIDGPTRVLIDPGHKSMFGHVENGLAELGLGIEDIGLILCTHAHPDHIEAVELFKNTSALFALHEKEWDFVKSMEKQAGTMGIDLDSISPDLFLKEGDRPVSGIELQVIHTPGHSPGSVSLYLPQSKVLFTGDLIFNDAVGRTDLPGGDGKLLKESIKRLSCLDVDWLLPGHEEIVSGAGEVKENFRQVEEFWFKFI
ncbi:MAG: MBL fold metallo-hydrolase [Thermodesulfobacteriota bacterium]|nr:MBL fold metallo-hydrolase [Thermodesulfobacteriota bacterium]